MIDVRGVRGPSVTRRDINLVFSIKLLFDQLSIIDQLLHLIMPN